MRFAGLLLLAGALTASAQEVPTTPVEVSMVALQAANDGKNHFDPALNSVKSALSDLKFDSFRRIQSTNTRAAYGAETRITINNRYTLYIAPLSKGRDGRVRAKVRITLAPRSGGGKPVNAVDTTVVIAPGSYVKIRGLRLDEGELVVLLTVSK